MRTYYIYKATNKINGKSYIGQTVHFEKRKNEHLHRRDGYCDPNSIFHKALDKYGHENFEWEILGSIPGKEMANCFEREMINLHNTYKPNGYNLTKGGEGGSMWNAIPVVQLTKDGEFVRRYDSACETKQRGFHSTGVLKCCRNETSQTKGFIFMFEDDYLKNGPKEYIPREIVPSSRSKTFFQCDMEGNFIKEFQMISVAEKELGISHSHIVGCLKGYYKSSGGYIFVYPEDFPIKDVESHKRRDKGVKIAKIDKDTDEVIAVYDRMTDAARELGGSHKTIWKAVRGGSKTAYGFKWKAIS